MPPFQFDDFTHSGLSTILASTPLRRDGERLAAVSADGRTGDRAQRDAEFPETSPPEIRVFVALEGNAELTAYLRQSGLNVKSLASPHEAVLHPESLLGNILLLDWDYPGVDPYDVCRSLGLDKSGCPVIVLSAQDDGFDEVMAFEFGAYDFLVKPVQPRVLLARIKACMRSMGGRMRAESKEHRLVFGRLAIDLSSRTVALDARPVSLSSAEFDLLAYLASRAGRIVRRDEIRHALCRGAVGSESRLVDSRMYRLRRRFAGLCDAQAKIKSVRPQGYLFCDDPW